MRYNFQDWPEFQKQERDANESIIKEQQEKIQQMELTLQALKLSWDYLDKVDHFEKAIEWVTKKNPEIGQLLKLCVI